MDTARYCYSSAVRGYHVYQENWEATHGEILSCGRETGNVSDSFAVSGKKHGEIVGHVPGKILAICSLFLWNH